MLPLDPVLSALHPQLNLLNPPKIPGYAIEGQQLSFCIPSYIVLSLFMHMLLNSFTSPYEFHFNFYSVYLCFCSFCLTHFILSVNLFTIGTIVISESIHNSSPGSPFPYQNHSFPCCAYVHAARDSMFLPNICTCPPNYMRSQCKRQ
jgi:hypothetical protein